MQLAHTKYVLVLLLCLIAAVSAAAQTTIVTGTINDPNGNLYANGTASAFQVVNSGQPQPPSLNVTTNASGFFTFSGPNALASPASYIFTVCAPTVNIGPRGNLIPTTVCFGNTVPIAVSGASQDISAALNPRAKLLGPGSGSSSIINPLNLTNPVAATNCVNQPSPPITFNSNFWNGTASVLDTWTFGVTFASCPNGRSTFGISNPNTNNLFTVTATEIDLLPTTIANPLLCFVGLTSGKSCIQVQNVAGSAPPWALPSSGPTTGLNCLLGGGGSPTQLSWQNNCTATAASTSQLTTKVVYAADTQWAGGVKANGHLFIATTNTTGGLSALKEMDGTTAYNPVAAGVSVGDYVACVDIFGKSSQTATLELGDGTVSSVTSTTIQSSNGSSTAFTGANCWTGTDDTAALNAAFNNTVAVATCGQLVLPAGRIIISSQPFFNSNNQLCSSKIKGQGSSATSGGVCCQLTRDYGTVFTPTNGFPFSGGSPANICQSIVLCDTSNSHGEISNFAIDALGMPFSSATSNKNAFALAANYAHELSVWGFYPGSGTDPHCAFSANTTGLQTSFLAAQGDNTAACIGGSQQSWTNPQFGNNGRNWTFTNAFNDTVSGGFEDEETIVTALFTNSTRIRFANVSFLGTAGGFAFNIDGTSSVWCDQCVISPGAFAEQAVTIAAGGQFTASQSFLGTGNSTTNASVHNLGTFFDNGDNQCSTGTGTANNSGGTVPGSCVDNTSNQAIPSLTLGTVNWTIPTDTAQNWAQWTPPSLADGVGVNVTRVEVTSSNTPACTVAPNLRLSNGTTTLNVPLSLSAAVTDSGVIAALFKKNAAITVSLSTVGTCTTAPVNMNVNVDWQSLR